MTWPELSSAIGSFHPTKALDEHLGVLTTMFLGQVLLKEGGVVSGNAKKKKNNY